MTNGIVEENPAINCGYPIVGGTRTPVRSLVLVYRETEDFDQTLSMFPHLTREQVRQALDYYILHPDRVNEDIEVNAQALTEVQHR